MITIINQVNIYHHIGLQKYLCVCVTRTLEVYSLSNFQICSAVLLTEAPMPYISSPRPIYFLTGNLYLLTPLINFVYSLLSLASGKSPICSIYL